MQNIHSFSLLMFSFFLFLGIGVVLNLGLINAQVSEEIGKNNESGDGKVILTSHKYQKDRDSIFDELIGQVKNIGNGTAELVYVKITYYDKNGDILGIDDNYIDLDLLQPGQKSSFSILRDKEITKGMDYYQIDLSWYNPDGSEDLVEDVSIEKDNMKEDVIANLSDKLIMLSERLDTLEKLKS